MVFGKRRNEYIWYVIRKEYEYTQGSLARQVPPDWGHVPRIPGVADGHVLPCANAEVQNGCKGTTIDVTGCLNLGEGSQIAVMISHLVPVELFPGGLR